MAEGMWKNGDKITAEKLNRMNEIAAEAHDGAVRAQIAELKLLCDEKGKIWGASTRSPEGALVTFPAVKVTMQPITFAPAAGEEE